MQSGRQEKRNEHSALVSARPGEVPAAAAGDAGLSARLDREGLRPGELQVARGLKLDVVVNGVVQAQSAPSGLCSGAGGTRQRASETLRDGVVG